MDWSGHEVRFMMTPGHSFGSMCVRIENLFFTGDTIMPYKPYFNGRDSNEEDWKKSINVIESKYDTNTKLYPGHGDVMTLGVWNDMYFKYGK